MSESDESCLSPFFAVKITKRPRVHLLLVVVTVVRHVKLPHVFEKKALLIHPVSALSQSAQKERHPTSNLNYAAKHRFCFRHSTTNADPSPRGGGA